MMPTQNHWMRWRSMMLLIIGVGICDTAKLGIDPIPSKYRVSITDTDTSHLLKPLMYLHVWELTPTCVIFDEMWTSWQLLNWKYRSLHTHIDLTSIPLFISLLAIFGLIRPPPTWEHGEYGSEGVELEAVDDVAKLTHLNGHEDASGGQQKDVQALCNDAQPQHSCGEKGFFLVIDEFQRRRRRRGKKKYAYVS